MPKGGEAYKAPDAKGVPAVNNVTGSTTIKDHPMLTIQSKKGIGGDSMGKKTKDMPKGG